MTLTVTFDEPVRPGPTIAFRRISGAGTLPGGPLTPTASAAVFTFAFLAEAARNGLFVPTLSAVDLAGNALAVQPENVALQLEIRQNTAPVARAGPDQTVESGELTLLDGSTSSDAETDPIACSWTRLSGPAPVTLANPETARPAFVAGLAGSYIFRLTATDDRQASSQDTVTVVVTAARPDLFAESVLAPVSAALATEGTSMPLSSLQLLLAYDRDRLAFRNPTWGPAASRFNPSVNQFLPPFLPVGFLTQTPTPMPAGLLATLTFDASGEQTRRARVSVLSATVTDLRTQVTVLRPTADAGLPREVATTSEGAVAFIEPLAPLGPRVPWVRLDARLSRDPNLPPRILRYRWTQLGGPVTAGLSDPASPVPTFVPAGDGLYEFELVADNGVLASPPASVRIGVNRALHSPIALAVAADPLTGASAGPASAPLPVPAGRPVRLDGRASSDPDESDRAALVYEWLQEAGPSVALSNPFSAVATFVAPSLPGDGARGVLFQLFVDDGRARSAPATASIEVEPRTSGTTWRLSLDTGWNLLSLDLQPATPGAPYDTAELAADTGASLLVRCAQEPGDSLLFTPWLAGAAGWPVRSDEAYLVHRRGPAETVTLRGGPWPSGSRVKFLAPGLNVIVLPADLVSGGDTSRLLEYSRVPVRFVARPVSATAGNPARWRLHLPGLTPPLPLEPGHAVLLSVAKAGFLRFPEP